MKIEKPEIQQGILKEISIKKSLPTVSLEEIL
jgi:hypothetical protein